ncbi:hypothetical protein [Marinicella meishanensis]|uniref:hypothetical protein n=1 Tax=Marinicella meishanensis TaxID=2873263 RepID=UPI001CC0DFAC|nr:hypothetical protein [Marinicella sp. NBU2979]
MTFQLGFNNNQEEVTWDNLYQEESFTEFTRLIIGCEDKEIPLILEFCKGMNGPFGLLHVLLVSRTGKEPGRYQSAKPLSYDELKLFLYENQEYFEQDGRSHLWVFSISNEGQFIYDNHNYIYAYGDLERLTSILKDKGFDEGEILIPTPHTHNYHVEFDDVEESLFNSIEWLYSPLLDSDDP